MVDQSRETYVILAVIDRRDRSVTSRPKFYAHLKIISHMRPFGVLRRDPEASYKQGFRKTSEASEGAAAVLGAGGLTKATRNAITNI